jgi:uncharacterized beta-barrel protein YwiB (DUF1934 family)
MRIAKPIFIASALSCALTLGACTQKPVAENVQWLTPPIETYANWEKASNAQHDLVLAYYAKPKTVVLRQANGETQTLVDGSVNDSAPSGLALAIGAKDPATMWRDKIPSKGLYLKHGNANPVELGEGTEPLARFLVAADGGGWHSLWYGEKAPEGSVSQHNDFRKMVSPNSDKYNIYYRHLGEADQKGSTERLFPGFYPQWIIGASGEVAVFTWDNTQTPSKILMRVRDATSGVFTEASVVSKTTETIPPIFKTFRVGARWFVVWLNQGGDKGIEFSVHGAWSDDKGAKWEQFDIPELNGFDVTEISVAGDEVSGHMAMAVSGSWRFVNGEAKSMFYVVRSQDRGATWLKTEMIRENAANDDSNAGKAQVAFGTEPGSLWLLWEDWREVRPRMYFAYSSDFGANWLYKNLPVATQPMGGNLLHPAKASMGVNPKGLYYIAGTLVNDSFKEEKLYAQQLTAPLAELSAKEFGKRRTGDEKSLKLRVNEYWQAMQDSRYDASYPLLDPFLRSQWNQDMYKQRMGRIKYTAHSIEAVDIHGNFADVRVKITGSVPKFMLNGKEVSAPERDAVLVERWLFLDGSWFREYSEESSSIKFTQYNK